MIMYHFELDYVIAFLEGFYLIRWLFYLVFSLYLFYLSLPIDTHLTFISKI